jgi:intermediate cleaving peptidase 55
MLDGAVNVYTDVPTSMRPSGSFERFFEGLPSTSVTTTMTGGEGVVGLLGRLKNSKVLPASPMVAKLRVVKSTAEIAAMRYAGQVAGRAHTDVMQHRWKSEKQTAVAFKMAVLNSKCEDESYIPVVAGGHNALSIHYVQNNALIR